MSNLTVFTCFSRLPPELRVRVWRYAALVPRIVHFPPGKQRAEGRASYSVTFPGQRPAYPTRPGGNELFNREEEIKIYGGHLGTVTDEAPWAIIINSNHTKTSAPLLGVCRESRAEIQKLNVYRSMFGFTVLLDYRGVLRILCRPRSQILFGSVFFNPSMDVLMMDVSIIGVFAEHVGADMQELRHIALLDQDFQFSNILSPHDSDFDNLLRLCERLIEYPQNNNQQYYTKLRSMRLILDDNLPAPADGWESKKSRLNEIISIPRNYMFWLDNIWVNDETDEYWVAPPRTEKELVDWCKDKRPLGFPKAVLLSEFEADMDR